MKLAVIDCGTNTFHLLVAEVLPSGQLRRVFKERKYVRLGQEGLDRIGEAPFQRGVDCLAYFKEKMVELGVVQSSVFGTEALRRASNGEAFVQKVLEQTGVRVELISGQEEARLIHLGVMEAAPDFPGKGLIMDIGGGSVEFVIASQEKVFWSQSFPIGVQRLFSNFHKNDPISPVERQSMGAFLEASLQPLFSQLSMHETPHLLGASGSFEVVEDLLVQERQSSVHAIVPTDKFYLVYEEIMQSSLKERYSHQLLPNERAELIVVAFGLIDFILRKASIRQIITSAYAMKEGKLLEMAGELMAKD
jgi:exopolyphosphatase/guanosine-5'-triphosphate,3'-diphosphate pyrophosphatase